MYQIDKTIMKGIQQLAIIVVSAGLTAGIDYLVALDAGTGATVWAMLAIGMRMALNWLKHRKD